ncbi:growth/differentiation factor 10 [Oncorhynchus kisutch]|uniref:Growth differentiation factor 10b n=1 Tax=Oncorhynchus kisutch TaxID=8019 RepID=A0A8C7MUI3_ONCKI|nr:growth/differentiation factor 10 [Oncorhynchus kisutch]
MTKILLHLVHLMLFFHSGIGEVLSEEPFEITQQDSDIHETTDSTSSRESARRDMVSINMFKVYEKYSKEPQRHRDENTVRSFKAIPGVSKNSVWFHFNLSSIQESEDILSATFHFLDQRPRHRPWICRRSRSASCRLQWHPPSQLLFRGTSPNSAFASLLGNVTLPPPRRGSWQTSDVSAVVKEARILGVFLITAEFDFGMRPQRNQEHLSPAILPYVLAYANDMAISEPNSVAMTLQRYGPFPSGEEPTRSSNESPPASRLKREALSPLDQILDNDLPEVQFNTLKSHELWESTYLVPKIKPSMKDGQKHGQESSEGLNKPQVLSFDERTMKKARRRQWSEPRVCARRYLRVDFADIGWSEWVLAPKAFDAYYCAGTCGFPIPKVARPSNHATIQSIVRAVGIVPGIPEPCCVPDRMSSLSVLFLDPSRNMVLKVYPNMSVETCACQ